MSVLGSNVLAEIIATVLLALLLWLLSIPLRLPLVYRKRRQLFEFFGLTKDTPNLLVYLSTVYVRSGGSVDFQGVPRTFSGPAIPSAELSIVEPLSKLFSNPFLDGLPMSFRNWLASRVHWSFKSITPTFKASPQDRTMVEKGNVFTVGSRYYNSAADLYADTINPILSMVQINRKMKIKVQQGPQLGDVFEQRQGQVDDLAIVEKLYDSDTNTTIFFAAGLGVVGTLGAVNFIIDKWTNLQEDFGSSPFGICLRFENVRKDPNAYKRAIELFRQKSVS